MAQRGGGSVDRLKGRIDLIAAAGALVAGWLFIVAVNRWHVTAPVVFLALGWLAVVLCGRFFWGSARAAAGEGIGSEDEGFELTAGRVAELEKEKRALLKAMKEVEFDREMGKMSGEDAAEITRVYRARAIEILKELEGEAAGEGGSIDTDIEREVRARIALAGGSARKAGAASPAGAGADAAAAGAGEDAAAPPAEDGADDAGAPGAGSNGKSKSISEMQDREDA